MKIALVVVIGPMPDASGYEDSDEFDNEYTLRRIHMATEDKVLALKIRRTLARKEADMTLMDVNCIAGVVSLTGTLREPRGWHGKLDLKEELDSILDLVRRIPGVKDVSSTVRVEGGGLTDARRQRTR